MHFKQRGFTLIELMITVAIIGLLASIALPSYNSYIVRSARIQAQTELLELASIQEKIYLNSNSYAFSVTGNYNGKSDGGLGKTTGTTQDGRYTIALDIAAASQTFTLTATPTVGGSQVGDGTISITESGNKTCAPTCGPGGKSTW